MAMQQPVVSVTVVLLLLIPLVFAQSDECPTNGSKLRFITHLSVNGCSLFVHDTGAADGPHLSVEPLMCVTESLDYVLPRYDPITRQTYVSVSVMLRDDTMLTEVHRRLRLLSPKSVTFASVSGISVSNDATSAVEALGFDWTPGEPSGTLRLGCTLPILGQANSFASENCSVTNILFSLRNRYLDIFESVVLSATLVFGDGNSRLTYNLMRQKQLVFALNSFTRRYSCLPACNHLRYFRSIEKNNCTARVHHRLDTPGNFLVEPLLCFDSNRMSNESVIYDYSRGIYYLRVDLLLQDGPILDAVRSELADSDTSFRSVSFMHAWRAQSHVAVALSRRFEISSLMVAADWRSGHIRFYCKLENDCRNMSMSVYENPFRLLRHIEWTVTSLVGVWCLYRSPERSQMYSTPKQITYDYRLQPLQWMDSCHSIKNAIPLIKVCHFSILPDNRRFVLIQQRVTGKQSFINSWTEYERGFSDETDFWIGLATIHRLTKNGATLRIEMKLWNGTELYAEYSGFKVGDASTIYVMTYDQMVMNMSTVRSRLMGYDSGTRFSTFNKDNDLWHSDSCSKKHGNGGWWFHKENTNYFNPNGIFPTSEKNTEQKFASWRVGHSSRALWLPLREVRMLVHIP